MPPSEQESALSRRRFLAVAGGAACLGVLGAPQAAAATAYTVTAHNNSTQFQTVCLYQRAVGLGVPSAFSLAWLLAPCRPGGHVTFTWSEVYSFVWAPTGTLTPGIVFSHWDQLAADPDDQSLNGTGFGFDNGKYGFVPATSGAPQVGSLGIDVLATVPQDTASVGIGMSSAPVFAAQADPGADLVFTPHPQYWIAAGTYTRGEVLDVEEIEATAELPFDGTFTQQAVLQPTGDWIIS
ncbi:hypothetical protein [Streptomyces sp. NPDC058579]|uniref:hypothetical protein n=1 Tax=Streptomyces sp. NPDC058579 TaxID=3346548 RepID=UPI003662991E